METLAVVIGVILALMLFGASLTWFVSAIREGDLIEIGASMFLFLLLLFVAVAITLSVREEDANPCVAWGPPETTYVMVGKIITPITNTPCIKRQNNVER